MCCKVGVLLIKDWLHSLFWIELYFLEDQVNNLVVLPGPNAFLEYSGVPPLFFWLQAASAGLPFHVKLRTALVTDALVTFR